MVTGKNARHSLRGIFILASQQFHDAVETANRQLLGNFATLDPVLAPSSAGRFFNVCIAVQLLLYSFVDQV